MHGADPGMLRSVFIDDRGRAIGGAVIHDDPFARANGLREHALDRKPQVGFFIANGSYDDVFVCLEILHEVS